MAITKCSECGKEISDKAVMCVGCGYPLTDTSSGTIGQFTKSALRTVTEVRSPINVFTFGMLLCSAVFALSSTMVVAIDKDAFKWAIHMFLAIVGLFYLIILYCPKALYRPDDLTKLDKTVLRDEPNKAFFLALLGMCIYLSYQIWGNT